MRPVISLLGLLLPLAAAAQVPATGPLSLRRFYAGLGAGRAEYFLPTRRGTYSIPPVLAPTLTAGAHLGRYVVAEIEASHVRRVSANTAILGNSLREDAGGADYDQRITAVWLRLGGSFPLTQRLRLDVLPSLIIGSTDTQYDYLFFDYAQQAYTQRSHLRDSSTETYFGFGGRVCYRLLDRLEASAQAGTISSLSFEHRNSYLGTNDYNGGYWSLGVRYCFGLEAGVARR